MHVCGVLNTYLISMACVSPRCTLHARHLVMLFSNSRFVSLPSFKPFKTQTNTWLQLLTLLAA